MAHGLSCSVACGIFPDQGWKLCVSPPLAGGFLTTVPPGKSLLFIYQSKSRLVNIFSKEGTEDNTMFCIFKDHLGGFPGGAVVKNLPANARDMGSSPGPGRSHMPQSN